MGWNNMANCAVKVRRPLRWDGRLRQAVESDAPTHGPLQPHRLMCCTNLRASPALIWTQASYSRTLAEQSARRDAARFGGAQARRKGCLLAVHGHPRKYRTQGAYGRGVRGKGQCVARFPDVVMRPLDEMGGTAPNKLYGLRQWQELLIQEFSSSWPSPPRDCIQAAALRTASSPDQTATSPMPHVPNR